MSISDDELRRALELELEALKDKGADIVLHLTPVQAFMLIGQIQLALRHPSNRGISAAIAEDLAHMLERILSEHGPALAELIARGWNAELDE